MCESAVTEKLINALMAVDPDATIKDAVKFSRYTEPVQNFLIKEAKIKKTAEIFNETGHFNRSI